MPKLTNPYVVVAILIGLLIIGILIGRNWNKWFPKKPGPAPLVTEPPTTMLDALIDPMKIPMPPPTILIPFSPYCKTSVYNYGGCSYTFSRYVTYGRIRWCEMKRTSCP